MTIEGDVVLGQAGGAEGGKLRPWDDQRPDEVLLDAWRSEADDDGRAAAAILCRYRGAVSEWLEAGGLTAHQREQVIGDVFLEAMDSDSGLPLADLLRAVADKVAREYRGGSPR